MKANKHREQLKHNKKLQEKHDRMRTGTLDAAGVTETAVDRAARLTEEQIEREIAMRQDMPPPPVPYFHQNVEVSAWGLTIHQEARLIAASSNSTHITVWAPALTEFARPSAEELRQDDLIERQPYDYKGFKYAEVGHHIMKPGRCEAPTLETLWYV